MLLSHLPTAEPEPLPWLSHIDAVLPVASAFALAEAKWFECAPDPPRSRLRVSTAHRVDDGRPRARDLSDRGQRSPRTAAAQRADVLRRKTRAARSRTTVDPAASRALMLTSIRAERAAKSSCLNQETRTRENNFAPKTVSVAWKFPYILRPCGVQISARAHVLRKHVLPTGAPKKSSLPREARRKWIHRWQSRRCWHRELPARCASAWCASRQLERLQLERLVARSWFERPQPENLSCATRACENW